MCRKFHIPLLTLFLSVTAVASLNAQSSSLTLEECYRLAKENYPVIKKLGIVAKTADYTVENANKGYLPKISFTGQATYQSQTILVLLLTLIGGFITALNIVKEKEIGTIEQINVTPIKKWQFILGKLIPFWIVGMIVFTIGLVVMYVIYGIFPEGSLLTLYVFAAIYLIALLGLGLLISTFADTQLQAMFIAYFFMMVFMLMSGFFTNTESMPDWARKISNLTPVTHFIKVVRLIVLKGSRFYEVQTEFYYLIGFAVVLNGLAIYNYRKTN